MKKSLLLLFAISFGFLTGFAQNTFPATGAAGIGTTSPNASALLDVTSTSKGVLVPRMTKNQRDAIATPATGLLIYQTNSNPGFYYFTGSAWTPVSNGANKALSNLNATSINQSLIPSVNNSENLGSASLNWNNAFLHQIMIGGNQFLSDGVDITNTFAGTDAGQTDTTPLLVGLQHNTFLGSFAGTVITTGKENTFAGAEAGVNLTTANDNCIYGYNAAGLGNSGDDNCFFGVSSGFDNQGGSDNTFIGTGAGSSNTTGSNNIAIGAGSLKDNISGSNNIAIGNNAGFISGQSFTNATAIGFNATALENNSMVLGQGVSVGIGSSAPSAKLHVVSSGVNSSTFALKIQNASVPFMSILDDGTVGIGTLSPTAKLDIAGGSGKSGITPNPDAVAVIDNNNNSVLNLLAPAASQSGVYFGNPTNNAAGAIVYNNSSLKNGLQFNTKINTRMVIDSTGRVGIGLTAPSALLHIANGLSGVNMAVNPTAIFEKNNNCYLGLASPETFESGIEFGLPSSSLLSGGIVYNNSQNRKSLQFRTGGNSTKMTIDSAGNVGIGTFNPTNKLEVNGNAAKPGGGSWAALSDKRMKQNVMPYKDGLKQLLNINPITYHYNKLSGYDEKPQYVGVLAQDIKEVAPYMVSTFKKEGNEYYMVDNSALTYMLVNSVKELSGQNDSLKNVNTTQQRQINNQQQQINTILQRLNELELAQQQCCHRANSMQSSEGQKVVLSGNDGAKLEQNAPNPFNHSTVIGYTLPQKFNTAQVMITDKNGKALKVVNISGAGKGTVNIEASTLAAGAYNYSLLVDGKLIDTKQMVLAK